MNLARVMLWPSLIASAASLVTCRGLVDPDLPGDAEQFGPPAVYATWWAMVEGCSEFEGSLESVTWFRTNQLLNDPRSGLPVSGYWSRGTNRIVLAGESALDGGTVRHEMLHSLIRMPGHPRNQFLGNCAGVVECRGECIADAGAAPSPPSDLVHVGGNAIEVTLEVMPANPTSSHDEGFFSITVKARNPASHPVLVNTTPGLTGPRGTFFLELRSGLGGVADGELPIDPSQTTFAAGETKRHVFDFVIGNVLVDRTIRPGTYSVRGAYAGHWTTTLTTVVGP